MDDVSTYISVLVGIAAGLLGLLWTVILAPHVYRILSPSIVTFPWDDEGSRDEIKNQTVVFAASYNPPHHGHLRMLEYLSRKYDRVIAVVGFNPNKQYLVSPEERADLLRAMLKSRSAESIAVEGKSRRCIYVSMLPCPRASFLFGS
jgi:cytidyltransferase-like protein